MYNTSIAGNITLGDSTMKFEVRFVKKITDIGSGNAVKYRHFDNVVEADKFAASVKSDGGWANVLVDGKLIGSFFTDEWEAE
jgi:hypothetical protein